MNFNTYVCNYCGKVGGLCQNPECVEKRDLEKKKEDMNKNLPSALVAADVCIFRILVSRI